MPKLQTVFFGSGPVALRSALALRSSFNFEAIITKPSTRAEMQAAFPGERVLSVSTRAELDELCDRESFASTFGLLIDFGIIVSQHVISTFPKGIINSHFSLLPEWRGADPITFAILSGQKQTGVSLMLLSAGMDEGLLLAQAPYDILIDETSTTLASKLIVVSAAILRENVPQYIRNSLQPWPQEQSRFHAKHPLSYSRKLTKEDGRLDWAKSAEAIEREIRAFAEWPHSYTTLAEHDVIVTKATVIDQQGSPGEIIATKNRLIVCCSHDSIEIQRLKPAGKKEMDTAAFLAGYGQRLKS